MLRFHPVFFHGSHRLWKLAVPVSLGWKAGCPRFALRFAPQAETTSGQSVAIQLLGRSPRQQPLTYTVMRQPAHGRLSGSAPNLTYTPNASFPGNDNFLYRVDDGGGAAGLDGMASFFCPEGAATNQPRAERSGDSRGAPPWGRCCFRSL